MNKSQSTGNRHLPTFRAKHKAIISLNSIKLSLAAFSNDIHNIDINNMMYFCFWQIANKTRKYFYK